MQVALSCKVGHALKLLSSQSKSFATDDKLAGAQIAPSGTPSTWLPRAPSRAICVSILRDSFEISQVAVRSSCLVERSPSRLEYCWLSRTDGNMVDKIRAKFLNEKNSSFEEPFAQSRVSCRRKEVTEKKEGARVDDLVSVLGRSAATTPKLA